MTPESKKNLISFIIVLIILGAGYFYFQSKTNVVAPAQNATNPTELAKATASLYSTSKIPASPQVASAKTIDQTQLPSGLADLINPKQTSLVIQQVTFVGDQKGYVIEYKVPATFSEIQSFYINLHGWNLTKSHSSSSKLVGLFELFRNNFNASVLASVIDAKNLDVIITIIDKSK